MTYKLRKLPEYCPVFTTSTACHCDNSKSRSAIDGKKYYEIAFLVSSNPSPSLHISTISKCNSPVLQYRTIFAISPTWYSYRSFTSFTLFHYCRYFIFCSMNEKLILTWHSHLQLDIQLQLNLLAIALTWINIIQRAAAAAAGVRAPPGVPKIFYNIRIKLPKKMGMGLKIAFN